MPVAVPVPELESVGGMENRICPTAPEAAGAQGGPADQRHAARAAGQRPPVSDALLELAATLMVLLPAEGAGY